MKASPTSTATLWTIGHSTHSIQAFTELLKAHQVQVLVDVRRFPFSRRHPHFNTEALEKSLAAIGIEYQTLPSLGGRRTPLPDSANTGWRNSGFRGYADYMQTEPFRAGISGLQELAEPRPTVIMCAEALPWRCHRSLIADDLVSRGWMVYHILSDSRIDAHVLTSFARLVDGQLLYPQPATPAPPPPLFADRTDEGP